MTETIVFSGKTGCFVRKAGDTFMLHRHDRDEPAPIARPALAQLLDAMFDMRLMAIDDVSEAHALLREEKEVARATRLFLILLDPEEEDAGLEEVADIADARLADEAVFAKVQSAMLAAPLPNEARIDRLKTFGDGRLNLHRLTRATIELQFSVRSVVTLFDRIARDRFPSLEQANAFLKTARREGLFQKLALANDAELIEIAKVEIGRIAVGEESAAIARILERVGEAELPSVVRKDRAKPQRRAAKSPKKVGGGPRKRYGYSRPVVIPAGVTATAVGRTLSVEGPKGTLSIQMSDEIEYVIAADGIVVRPADDSMRARAFWGMQRTLVQNLVTGVSEGFTKTLEITGVGYSAAAKGKTLNLQLGYSRDVKVVVPDGVEVRTPDGTTVEISGIDKQKVAQIAAEIRRWRKPEPYKGKGIKYRGDYTLGKRKKQD